MSAAPTPSEVADALVEILAAVLLDTILAEGVGSQNLWGSAAAEPEGGANHDDPFKA